MKPSEIFRKTNFLVLAAVILLVLLNLLAVFGDWGLLELQRLKAEKAALETKVLEIENANRDLIHLMKRLENEDPELVEHIAKHEHKMVRPGEMVIITPAAPKGKHNEH